MRKKMRVLGLVAMLCFVALAAMTFVVPPRPVSAETDGPSALGYNLDGKPAWRVAAGADWFIDDGDDVEYQDITIDLYQGAEFIQRGGSVTFENVTLLMNSTSDHSAGFLLYQGNFTAKNTTIQHYGTFADDNKFSYWFYVYDDWFVEGYSMNVTFFNTTLDIPDKETDLGVNLEDFSDVSFDGAFDPGFVVDRGNFTSYYSTIRSADMSFNDTTTDGSVSFVNTEILGNYSHRPFATTNYYTAHMMTFHGNDTRNLSFSVEDADNDIISGAVNETYPSGNKLTDSWFYAPDKECIWFAVLNHSITAGGLTNGSYNYPFTVYVDYPGGWTDEDTITYKDYSTKNVTDSYYRYDPDRNNTDYSVSETDEDTYSTRTLRTAGLNFGASQFWYNLRSPMGFDWGGGGLDDAYGKIDLQDNGSASLDSPTLVANAGSDVSVVKGSIYELDASLSTHDNPIDLYQWTVKNGSTTEEVLTGSSPNINTTTYSVGIYNVTLFIRDDEEATSSDLLVLTVTNVTPSTGTSAAAEDVWSWADDWYKFWKSAFWTETWESTLDFARSDWGIVIAIGILAFCIIELFTDVHLVKTISKSLRRK